MRNLLDSLEVGIVTIVFLGIVALACYVGYLSFKPYPANGHPPEDCPKVENPHANKIAPHADFLSKPVVVVPLKSRVKAFQKKHGLKEDGIIGSDTKHACFGECGIR